MPSLDFWQVESCSKAVKMLVNVGMDRVVTLKRALEVDLRLCIFCEKRNKPKDDVRETTSYSKKCCLRSDD